MNTILRKAAKAALLARVPEWRRALRHGVAASVEHDRLQLPNDFRTVIDVGANRGQFAVYSAVRFPRAQIYSLEPLKRPRRKLQSLFKSEPRVHVIGKAAGATTGRATLNVSRQDDSSSLLAMADLQTERFPGTAMIGREQIEVTTLDETFGDLDLQGPILLKLDVQGFELEALKGAERLLDQVDAVLTEASFVAFYEDQVLFDELNRWLNEAGFSLVSGSISSQAQGRWEQGDFLYERRDRHRIAATISEPSAA
jgi:FkbM family methyltransferase